METPEKQSQHRRPKQQTPLKIEISQYNSLMQLLGDYKSVCRLVLTIGLLLLVLFAGLSFITLVIKQFYPYNDIKTNMLGATTVRDETTEVTYWLFNTADLWANSGIHVEKGDVLTIRASGKAHTAIHHLVQDVENNVPLRDNWVGTEGDERTEAQAKARGKYRIFADLPQDALIMQVIPEERKDKRFGKEFYLRADNYITDQPLRSEDSLRHLENFYFIGKERIDLHINHPGILHFAVNDILLTRTTICKMLCEEYGLDWTKERAQADPKEQLDSVARKALFNEWFRTRIDDKAPRGILQLGVYKGPDSAYVNKNELYYYYNAGYYNAWYDDNVGSLLVLIERKHTK